MLLTVRHFPDYLALVRLNKPIGIWLLLWPTLWALWLASGGMPNVSILLIFVFGVVLMRSAGCAINDIADRKIDPFVARTKNRPLASGRIQLSEAITVFLILLFAAFLLVLLCNPLTIRLAFVGAALATIYPFLKRVTSLPQFGLGMAFSWGVPMAFAAVTNRVSATAWIVFAAAVIWPVIYDTMYAMADQKDDQKIGVRSTAILFGSAGSWILAAFQLFFLMLMLLIGYLFGLLWPYYVSLAIVVVLFVYHQYLIKGANPDRCFYAFLHSNWVGMVVFLGIVISDLFR